MIGLRVDTDTVLSAPNAVGCANPACRAALDAGTYDETNPPDGCTNHSGLYVPDEARSETIVIGWNYTYECERCHLNGTIYSGSGVVHDCGKAHRGDYQGAQTNG